MRVFELLFEASADVGRKYQHVEDLIFTGIPKKNIPPGAEGGRAAVRIIQGMASTGGANEIKWDGSPVVYWGRDEDGTFRFIPKNAWEYLKRGKTQAGEGVTTLMSNADDVKNFILGTGKTEPGKEKQRQAYANQLADLWPYFEKISPETGFLEGGLLFYPGRKPDGKPAQAILNPKTGEYEFSPNISGFHIGKNSDLGKRIKGAKLMVAATGYYQSIGGDEGRYLDAEGLSTPDVIVQGTTYVEEAPGIDSNLLDDARAFIDDNEQAINDFLQRRQPGPTGEEEIINLFGDILYKFYNENLRIAGVKEKFKDWAEAAMAAKKVPKARTTEILNHPGLDAVLTAVEKLSVAKMDMHRRASAGTHSGIRQTNPEGYVYQDPETGQFVKAIDQANWAPRKD
jgi:hypothetical protein